jgi:dTDP-4-amino-4,6-dideoxygalactose transaminase
MRSQPRELINFTKPRKTDSELVFIEDAINSGMTWGGGEYSKFCARWISENIGAQKALITTSATDALEMSALLLDIKPGDEVIMPSYNFVSAANAYVMRGGVPVFIDVDRKTMNLDVSLIEGAINERTKAVVIMNYAGFSCDIDKVKNIAKQNNLYVIEDAAQSILAEYKGKPLGSFGDLACFSFHGTKNVSCGEGGALLINNPDLIERAEIILEKGTNRSKFLNGEVDRYTWVDLGSSFLSSEISCSYLKAQLLDANLITQYRIDNWNQYHDFFKKIALDYNLELMIPDEFSKHNGHTYYILLPNSKDKYKFMSSMKKMNVQCASHYVPLHNSVGGIKFSKIGSRMDVTNENWEKLIRLPMWSAPGMPIDYILTATNASLKELTK